MALTLERPSHVTQPEPRIAMSPVIEPAAVVDHVCKVFIQRPLFRRGQTKEVRAVDDVSFTVDRNTFKHGKFLPGTHIPIFDPSHLDEVRPDYIVVLPWNLREEITQQLAHTREWGARLVFPLPTLEVLG